MAKKKTKKKTGKKVGAVKVKKDHLTNLFLLFTGGVIGAAGRRFADNAMTKQTAVTIKKETMQFIRIGEALAGFVAAYFVENMFVTGLGVGVATDAGINILQAQGQLTGIGASNGPIAIELPKPNPNFSKNPLPQVGQPGSASSLYENSSIPSVGKMSSKYAGVYSR